MKNNQAVSKIEINNEVAFSKQRNVHITNTNKQYSLRVSSVLERCMFDRSVPEHNYNILSGSVSRTLLVTSIGQDKSLIVVV